MSNLNQYKLDMQPLPENMETAIANGIEQSDFPSVESAVEIFDHWKYYSNRILRSKDGRVLVTCTTDMPSVTPAMIDWWFGWHLPETERYQLWHPKAHIKATIDDARSQLTNDREKYIGNVSHVDEYIGKELAYLAIAFFHPQEIGMEHIYADGGTAICARTSDRKINGEGGQLVHLLVPTENGCEMRSVFWLGDLTLKWPIIGRLLTPLMNTARVRNFFIKDHMPLDLLRHCAEEMNHLARFLPDLYNQFVITAR